MRDKEVRSRVRRIIREEIDPSTKLSLLDDTDSAVRNAMEEVLMGAGVERAGLSRQQAALFYRELCHTVESVIDDYSTIQVRDQSLRDAAAELGQD